MSQRTPVKQSSLSSSTTSTSSSSTNSPAPTKIAEKRDKRLDEVTSHREDLIQQRQRQANEAKARTLQMYDNMAKSGNAGDHKPLDIKTYAGRG